MTDVVTSGKLPGAERWFLVALLAVFAAVSVQYSVKVMTPRNGETTRSAIVRWRDQLLQLDAGENIYERFTYPNPPIMALMLRPLAELPPLAGALVWFYLKVGMALLCFAMAFRLAEDVGVPFPTWGKALAVLLSLRPILGDLMHGNVNLLIAFLVLSGLVLFQRKRDYGAGVVLALAIACKVTPALFAIYFIWKRAWKVCIGVGAGLILFLFVVPGVVLGWSANWELLSSWFSNMVAPFIVGGVITSEHPNQSLPGLIARLLTHSPSFSDYEGDRYVANAYHNFVDLGAAAKYLVKGCMLLFAMAIALTCRTPTEPRKQSRLGMEYSIILLGMLLFSERTWKHHAVTLVLPFAVLSYQLFNKNVHRTARWWIVSILGAAGVLMAMTSTVGHDGWAKLAQVYGAYTITFGILACGQMALLHHSCTASSEKACQLTRRAA